MKELGQHYKSEFSGEDVKPEILAEELGVIEFRLPDEHYQHAEIVIQQLAEKIIPDLRGLGTEEIGNYLVLHRQKLFDIFDAFPEMHRMPLLVKKNVIVAHGLISAQLLKMSSTEFYNIFLQCMHFYLYLKSVKNLSKLYETYPHTQTIGLLLDKLVQDECRNEISCAWGMRSSYFFNLMVPGERGSEVVQNMLRDNAYEIPMNLRAEYKRKKISFWRQEGLEPERILLNISHLVEDKISLDDQHKFAELDVPALNFFLCQNHILGYEEIVSKIFRNPDHTATWVAWINIYFNILMQHDSQARKVFYYVFGLEGNLFENGLIPNRLRRKKEKTKKGTTGKGLPEKICDILEKQHRFHKDKLKEERKRQKPAETVARITPPAPSQTAVNALISRETAKITVPAPDTKTLFPDLEDARKNKTQLSQIDFSQCDFPEGTTIRVERCLPAKKPSFELLNTIDTRGINIIPTVFGRDIQGHFTYRITFTLPLTHCFEGKNVFEISYYAKAEPTPAEIEEEKRQQEVLRSQPTAVATPVAPLVAEVAEQVEKIIDPAEMSLIAAAFVLEANLEKYSNIVTYEGGLIEIVISDADASEVLGDDLESLLPIHKTWTIQEDDTVHPYTDNTDIRRYLFAIKEALHAKFQEKIKRQQEEDRQILEQGEYEEERLKFSPILEFARGFQFEGKQNGHFDDQKKILMENLRSLGWSLPVSFGGSQVIWRHIAANVRILYTSKQCISFDVNGEQGALTGAQRKCYEEVGQAFAHIARFFNTDTRERKKMVAREQSLRKEALRGAFSCDKNLDNGQAPMVLFGPYQRGHGVWSSKFPLENTPRMLPGRVSRENIEKILEQYPFAELCYRRDLLCINGEISEEARNESVENTLQNLQDLRNSPRARYILKKRILITLELEKFSGETTRAPIKHEKNKKSTSVSALDTLLELKEKKNIQSSGDVTEEFLNEYINLLEKNKIRVHYVWPISARWDEHQKQMKKHRAKMVVETHANTTAD